MKIPEPAPNVSDILRKEAFFKKVNFLKKASEMQGLIQKANGEYIYWDKVKYLSFPEDINPEIFWAYLKLIRMGQNKGIPAKDTKGNFFGFWLPESIQKELHFIDQNASGNILMDSPSVHAGQKERYLVSSIMEEAIASSQLEGAATTRKHAKAMLRSGRKPKNKAEQMIVNNYLTIKDIKEKVKEPLTPNLISYFQAMITHQTLEDEKDSGKFRTAKDEIQVVDNEGHVLHVPPPAEAVQREVELLCEFANENDDSNFIHPVVKATILHFWLAYIHPYVDGNGRTSRVLFYWFMLKHGYWMIEYLSISRIIVKSPSQYARAFLYSEIDDQDITYFIVFHLRVIHLAIELLNAYLKRQQKQIQEAEKYLKNYPGLNNRQITILQHALSHPDAEYTVEYYKNVHDIVYQTARTDLLGLQKKGLFKVIKRGGTFYFTPNEVLHIKLKESKQHSSSRQTI